MPEIKLKHIVSFSSEDKVHTAENLVKPEAYRKWKCATPGEKNATVVLQFEKASQIHSIDIGNESSAFVEILVGRTSDNLNDFQVLLVASSFMSPLESRNGTHTNRVRMFGPEKLSQNVKDEKWDCVQIVCTQPFNKNIAYGLSFIKFISPPEKMAEAQNATAKLGAFKVKYDDEEDSSIVVGSWFGKQKAQAFQDKQSSSVNEAPSYAAAVLASSSTTSYESPKNNVEKRKSNDKNSTSDEPSAKKSPRVNLNKDIIYKQLDVKESKKSNAKNGSLSTDMSSMKKLESQRSNAIDKSSTIKKPAEKVKKKMPFNQIMKKVVFVLSGFVNPMRSQLRDKAVEMGARYRGDWDSSCTHLVCAFLNTPKYIQVRFQDGRVVTKEWILDSYVKKILLPWTDYKLGSYNIDTSGDEFEESDEEFNRQRNIKNDNIKVMKLQSKNVPSSKNETNSPDKNQSHFLMQNSESETEDEDALEDYMADTDVDSDSEGNTEDEIRKVESRAKKTEKSSSEASTSTDFFLQKPSIDDLPLPELPNFFKQMHFYIFGDFSFLQYHNLQRHITAYNGKIEDYMSDKTKYVITDAKWDANFEEVLDKNEDLIFIKSLWIYKCHEAGKLVPYQPYIVTPD